MDAEQRRLVDQFREHSCFEFMGQAEVRQNDPAGFVSLWEKNVQWLRDVAEETGQLIADYKRRHVDQVYGNGRR